MKLHYQPPILLLTFLVIIFRRGAVVAALGDPIVRTIASGRVSVRVEGISSLYAK